MKINFNPPDKYGEIQSQSIKLKLEESPMYLELDINGTLEKWHFTFTKAWQGIGPKTGDAINGRISNVSHKWGEESAASKHVILNVIGHADNEGNARLIIWGTPK